MAYVLFRSLHLIAAVVFAGALIIKNLATGRLISQQDANHLAWLSILSLLSGLVIAGCGTALWFWTGKPATFYSENPVFQIKIGLCSCADRLPELRGDILQSPPQNTGG